MKEPISAGLVAGAITVTAGGSLAAEGQPGGALVALLETGSSPAPRQLL